MAKAIASEAASRDAGPADRRERVALIPQRSNGRERVALILNAAAEVIQERGYEAATMKEIAERSDTKIGSLYRFFPTKELLADALMQLYTDSFEAQWQGIIAKAATGTTEQFSDLLVSAHLDLHRKHPVLPTLLESGPEGSSRRQELRARNIERVAEALRVHAPHLKRAEARSIAAVMLYNMRAMLALTLDASGSTARGPIQELKLSARAYLACRLKAPG